MYRDHFETFTHCGLTFAAYTAHDDSHGAPWEEDDGCGIVREARGENYANARPLKNPGERFLWWERGCGWAYDWAGTMKKARADGWGLNDESRAKLAATLKREPTPGEIVAESVRLDFERLRRWCANEWHYVGVIVELLDTEGDGTGEEESLWGIESDSPDYHAEVARDLAGQIAARLNLGNMRRKNLKREGAARSEVIRVRA